MKESKKIASNAAQNRKPGSFESFIKNTGVILLLTAVVASLAITTTYVKYFSWSPSYSHDRWAQFGDFIGGTLNPIFGFISLMAILITLFVQARELSYSTEALQDQGESLRMQSFENTFFSLLKILNDSINNAEVEEGQYKGARAFRHMWKMLNDSYSFYVKNKKSNDDVELISKSYDLFYNKNQDSLDSFLRNVLRIT
ncbi:hypothetical protein K8090_13870 [Halomonas meridiana]|uniref:hypothetical protein n=1 Tax=Vreelandella aquamarina TaxID=77097 RepID=UPI001E5AC0DE|nr:MULTISPECIES: hypothetical protein [Halomonas]MCD1652565.1 hypothetical protein [Halomonas axialensis]MCD2088820.1 hypothetical protein [Halomonas meridiana]